MFWIVTGFLVIISLILISGFFSSSEMAFVSINRALICDKARKGNQKAQILGNLLKDPDSVISAIVIGNNIVNIFASILAGAVATMIFGSAGIGIATIIMTLLLLIFSEVTPKALGIKNEQLALKVARPLEIITRFFHPLVIFLKYISDGIIKIIGGKNSRDEHVTEDEIMAMMRLGEEEGTIETDEREMMNEVFEFDETHAYEVYVPKEKIEFIHEKDSIGELITKSIKTGFSRFPVYRDNFDDIVGMAHVKDTLGIADTTLPVKTIMRKVMKIDPRMKVDDVLREMKRKKTHLALLLNKNKQILGLVSMEDLVEEIFGEISDEHDS
jgi:CBS domain containing-hemolysin-like protein